MYKQIDRRNLAKEIHQNAVAKGFWHTKLCEAGAQGTAGHSPQHYLMLVICELSEAVEAHRKDKRANRQAYEARTINGFESKVFELYIKDTLEDELADAYIRLLDFAEGVGFKLEYRDFEEEEDFDEYLDLKESYDTPLVEEVFRCIFEMCMGVHYAHLEPRNCLGELERLALMYDIDLSWHITEKMKYNAQRPTLHGKRY